MAFDNPENPTIIEDFIRAIGAEPVIYPYRNECCGGYISLKEKEMAENMFERIRQCKRVWSRNADHSLSTLPL